MNTETDSPLLHITLYLIVHLAVLSIVAGVGDGGAGAGRPEPALTSWSKQHTSDALGVGTFLPHIITGAYSGVASVGRASAPQWHSSIPSMLTVSAAELAAVDSRGTDTWVEGTRHANGDILSLAGDPAAGWSDVAGAFERMTDTAGDHWADMAVPAETSRAEIDGVLYVFGQTADVSY